MNRCGLRRYPYPTEKELQALLQPGKRGEKMSEALRQRQLQQMKEQLPRLDAMIAKAQTAKDARRFEAWRSQLIKTLRKEGAMPKTTTKAKDCVAKGEAHRWVIKGSGGTCKKCAATRTFDKKVFEVTESHRERVLAYVKERKGQPREAWSVFARAIGVSGTNLGHVIRTMKEEGLISEPEGRGSMVYVVVPAKDRAKAKRLYQEQKGAEESHPKAEPPANVVDLEGQLAQSIKAKKAEKAQARKASRKAA